MKIEYLRTAEHSYMVVKEADFSFEHYEVQMILHNEIPNLLPMRIIVGDGMVEYWYDVTGMQSLEKEYALSPVGCGKLCFLLKSICDLKEQMEDYLLNDRNVAFSSHMVYYDRINERIRFCYIPGYEQVETSGIRTFFEEVLQNLDHEDSEAVRIGYDVYERCAKVDFVAEDVRRCLKEYRAREREERQRDLFGDGDAADGAAADADGDLYGGLYGDPYEDFYEGSYGESRGRLHEEPYEESYAKTGRGTWAKPEAASSLEKKRKLFARKKKKRRAKSRKPEYREVLDEEQVLDYVSEKSGGYNPGNPTVCFPRDRMKTVWELSYQGAGAEDDFRLEKFPFLLGKDESRADGVLHADSVSRIHAQITKGADGLYLEDYNSTNGTYVNGALLPMNTPVLLHKGDRILFSAEEYVLVDRLIPT